MPVGLLFGTILVRVLCYAKKCNFSQNYEKIEENFEILSNGCYNGTF